MASVKRFFIVGIIAIFEIDVDRIGVSLHESKNGDYPADEFFSESILSLTKSNFLSYFYPMIN